uniref:Uncharacterized protein n=1 Tax=Biomphalaria glabrata TaxID=6526 RepID=A0A2C9M587_BIOGL
MRLLHPNLNPQQDGWSWLWESSELDFRRPGGATASVTLQDRGLYKRDTKNIRISTMIFYKCANSWWARLSCVSAILLFYLLWTIIPRNQSSKVIPGCPDVDGLFVDACDLTILREDFLRMNLKRGWVEYPGGSVCHRGTDGMYVKCLYGKWIEFLVKVSESNQSGPGV